MINSKQIKKFKEFLGSKTTKSQITRVALITIAISATPIVVMGGAALGNAVQVFKMFNKNKSYKNRQIADAVRSLHRNKLVEYVSSINGVTTIRITQKGESKIRSFAIDLIKIKKPKKWDGKWRIVMFDLPVQYKNIRNSLRLKLKQIGFIQFQKSVWLYPYPCFDELLFIADYYKVSKYIEIVTASEVLNDIKLRKAFSLN